MNFTELAAVAGACAAKPLFLFGAVLVFAGLAFKIAAFPFQIWTPDVYQGAPTPVTAFLAVGSKAAGIVLLLRVLFVALPPGRRELAEPPRHHLGDHHPLRQPLRHPAAEREAPDGLFEHRPGRLSAPRRRRAQRPGPVGGALLPRRLPLRRARLSSR